MTDTFQPGPGKGLPPWLKDVNQTVNMLWAQFSDFAGDIPAAGTKEYIIRRRSFCMGALMMRRYAMALTLQILARERPLDETESKLMDRVLNRMVRKKRGKSWRWTPSEDAKLKQLMARREENGRPKPYTKNPEIKRLATRLGRSYMATHRRMERLRRADNCSNAGTPAAR